MDSKICVIGANGFIGSGLVRRLARNAGLQLRAVSRRFSPELKAELGENVEFVEADMMAAEDFERILDGVDCVYQCVSLASPGLGNKQLVVDIENNLAPQVGFLERCVEQKIGRYIFLSSGGTIYGRPKAVPISEEHETTPLSSYGLTKLCVEKYIQMFGEVAELDYSILRLSNPYGPGQIFKQNQGLIPAVLSRFQAGAPIMILGDGSAQRDYIYIDDAIEALATISELPAPPKQILNIGSGVGRSILDVISAVEAALGRELEKEFVNHRKTDVDVNVLDISKAKSALQWEPKVEFGEGVRRTVEYMTGASNR